MTTVRPMLGARFVACAVALATLTGAALAEPLPLYLKDDGRTFQVSSHSPDGGDAWPVPPGETLVLADLEGPAILQNMWFTCSGLVEPGEKYLRHLILRMYWDDEDTPSVEAPFGDFFGNGFSRRTPWMSQHLGVTSGGFYSYFPMPFRKRARIEVENTLDRQLIIFFHFLGQRYKRLPKDALYFHAHWRRENPTIRGQRYTILDATGNGYFAGVNLFMQAYDKGDKWNFLEGDEHIFIDGEETASICGTGGEDYFQGGWYFIDGPFNGLYHGLILKDAGKMQAACYRFHLRDRVNFSESVRVEIEHGNRPQNAAKADFSSVAYWYQDEPHQAFPRLNPDRDPVPLEPAFVLPGAIEWEGTPKTGPLYVSTYVGGWSNNMGASFDGNAHAATGRPFDVPSDGAYVVGVQYIASDQGALAQVRIDGQDVGAPVDTYRPEPRDNYLLNANTPLGHQMLGEVTLSAGKHDVEIAVVGVNPASKGKEVMVDCVTVLAKPLAAE